jgi:transposase
MNCPRCKESNYCKDGVVGGRQRYQCKSCGFRYTVAQKSDVKPVDTKRLALSMYLEGVGFRAIGRILNISYGTVYQWVKKWGEKVSLPQNPQGAVVVEFDEMHSYIGSKKTIAGYGLLLIDLTNGTSLLSLGTDPQIPESDSGRK